MHMFHTMLLLLLLFAFSSAQKSSSATSTSSFEPTRQTRPSYVCGSDYNCSDVEIVGQLCQCEQKCILRGDCCSMTYEVCFPNVTFNYTGNGTIPEQNQTSQFLCETTGCRSVVIQALPCQCDSGCATRGDCCDDYTTACRTPPTTTTIPVDVQTATTARARNLFSTVTATQVQSPDSTAVVATTQVQSPDSTAVVATTQVQSPDSTEGVATTQRPSSASSTSSAPKVSSSATPTGDGSGEHPTNATLSAPTVEAMPGCYLYGCDNRSDAHECQCDSECLLRSDCCDDAINLCAGNDTGNTTGNRMTNGTSAPTGPFTCAEIGCGSTGARCSCVSGCLIMNKCCGDYTKVCSLTTTSSPTSATLAPPTAPRLPSCVALSKILNKSACGYRAGQLCQCDRRCSVTNDCCPDFDVSICAPTPGPTTPALPTTARATTVLVTRAPTKPPPLLCANEGCDVHDRDAPCQCLPNCVKYQDCCSDFVVFCKYNGTFPPPTTSSTSSRSSITVKASTASNGTENIATATLGGIGTTRPPPAQAGSSMSSIPVSSPSGRTVESTTSRSSSSGFASSASSSSGVVITAMPSTEARTSSVETERATTTSRVSTSAEKITRGSSSLVPSSVASSSSTGGATTTPSTSSSEKATNTSPTIRSSTAPTSKEVTPFSTTGRISTASSAKGTSLSPTSRVATASSGKGSTLSSTSRVSTEQATTMSPTTASRVSTASSGKRATMSPKNRGSTASSGSKGREPSSSPFLTASVPLQGSTSSSSSHPVSTSTTSSTSISTATSTKRPRSSRQVGVVTSTPSSGTTTSASSASPVTSASPSAMSASSSTVSPRQETTSARIETSTEQVDAKATIAPDQRIDVNSLTEDEKTNSLTIDFDKVELLVWIRLYEESFRQAIAGALRESSSNRRKRAVVDVTANDVIYVTPTPQIVDNYLRVVFFVRDPGSKTKVVQVVLLQQAVVEQKIQIEKRASVSVTSIRTGIPKDLLPDSSDNTTLIIAVVCSVAVGILILIFVLVICVLCRRRSKYEIAGSRYGVDYNVKNVNDIIDDFAEPKSDTMYRKKEDDNFPDVVAMTTFGSGDKKSTHL